eukprot:IDg8055t1
MVFRVCRHDDGLANAQTAIIANSKAQLKLQFKLTALRILFEFIAKTPRAHSTGAHNPQEGDVEDAVRHPTNPWRTIFGGRKLPTTMNTRR